MAARAPMRVALVGSGMVSKNHIEGIKASPGVELAVAVDLDPNRAKEAADLAGGNARWSTQLDEVLADPEIDVAAILLPHHVHAQFTLRALSAGKHVLVEKPMALTLKDCAEMIKAAEANQRLLAVGQVLRFRAAHRVAHEAIRSGVIGSPVHTIRHRYASRGSVTQQLEWSRDAKSTGGLLYGNGSHEMDAVLWMLQERPVRVYARAGLLEEGDARGASELSVLVELEGGGHYTLTMSRGTSRSVWEQWTVGSQGSIHLQGNRVSINGDTQDVEQSSLGGFDAEWESVRRAVQEGQACEVDARTVWPTMVALECARLSIERGRPVEAAEVDTWRFTEASAS